MVKIRIDSNEFEVEQAVANHITALTNKCDAANVKQMLLKQNLLRL